MSSSLESKDPFSRLTSCMPPHFLLSRMTFSGIYVLVFSVGYWNKPPPRKPQQNIMLQQMLPVPAGNTAKNCTKILYICTLGKRVLNFFEGYRCPVDEMSP